MIALGEIGENNRPGDWRSKRPTFWYRLRSNSSGAYVIFDDCDNEIRIDEAVLARPKAICRLDLPASSSPLC